MFRQVLDFIKIYFLLSTCYITKRMEEATGSVVSEATVSIEKNEWIGVHVTYFFGWNFERERPL